MSLSLLVGELVCIVCFHNAMILLGSASVVDCLFIYLDPIGTGYCQSLVTASG